LIPWHRAVGREAAHTESIEAAGTACHRYDGGSYITASRRRGGGAHEEQRGSRYCLSPPLQRVVHHGIAALPGWRQRVENIVAVGTACHRYDSGSYITASRHRGDGST